MYRLLAACLLFAGTAGAATAYADDAVWGRVQHGTVDSGGVKIHYATLGSGPLVVMVHGFPDFWYSWRDQMAALSDRYRVVAIDQRGYNLSDKPTGQAQYDMSRLVGDLRAVVRWVDNTLTIVTVPGAGHWVQTDAADVVSATMKAWLQLPLR